MDRLRARDVLRPRRGTVVLEGYRPHHDPYVAKCLEIGATLAPGHFISRRSAAILHGLPCPEPPEGLVEVGSVWPRRAPRRADIAGHRVRAGTISMCEKRGLMLPSAADVWCQLAAVLELDDLVVAGDSLITGKLKISSGGRRRRPRASPENLALAIERHRGSTGTGKRDIARALLRAPVDSPQETRLRLLIRASGFTEPVVGCPVPVIGRVLHADLGYPDLKIAIEYQGAYHFGDQVEQGRWDTRRMELMRESGWRVLLVTAYDLAHPREFLRRLASAIAAASAQNT